MLPVATLCFKLAERRLHQREAYLRKQNDSQAKTNSVPEMDDMDRCVEDLRCFLSDVFRLLKNCLNLISVIEAAERPSSASDGRRSPSPGRPINPCADLKSRAVLLLCQLYLSTPSEDIIACASSVQKPIPLSADVRFL